MHLYDSAFDLSDFCGNLTANLRLPEAFEGLVNGFLEAMLLNRLTPLASHHICVNGVFYVI
jgi:hypothetical protein